MSLVRVFSSPAGKAARIALGAGMMTAGARIDGVAGLALIFGGLVPIAAAVFGVCLIAPLFGAPLRQG